MGKPDSSGKISFSLLLILLLLFTFSLSIPLYPNGNPFSHNYIQSVCTNNGVSEIGVCYGMQGSNLPKPVEVIDLYIKNNIRKMRIYNPNQAVLQALRGSNIDLVVGVPYTELQGISTNQTAADSWIQTNIRSYEDVRFKYVAVGNEVIPSLQSAPLLFSALKNIHNALSSAGLDKQVKVSTAVSVDVFEILLPPSAAAFTNKSLTLLGPIIKFLTENQSPLLVNLYPYLTYSSSPTSFRLDDALLKTPWIRIADGQLSYWNLFDAMLDATYTALEKAGGETVEVVVSETGWPSNGSVGASVENARTYNNNVAQHIKGGTPKKPGKSVETYIFAMFDENQKPIEQDRSWGIFLPTKLPKYPIAFG